MSGITDLGPRLANADIFNLLGKKEPVSPSVLIQEDAGFYLGISPDSEQAGKHAAMALKEHYDRWCDGGGSPVDTIYKNSHFTIAVGGGNTVKAVYKALLDLYTTEIEWFKFVRFFVLEESSGEGKRESAQKSLINNLVTPLCEAHIRKHGLYSVNERLDLPSATDRQQTVACMVEKMVHGFDFRGIRKALRSDDKKEATKLARAESKRYQKLLSEKLGEPMAFHQIISGIGKDGGIGAFSPYDKALQQTEPGLAIINKDNGAIRIALNRGILKNADQIHLVIAGSLKLKALGRFEMEDPRDFERSVMETPIRMLRESRRLAEKVSIFADDSALHFDEDTYSYRDRGKTYETKAETRKGLEEDNGIHIFLLHGFMGLYTFVNLLVRLPSAWTVSALHRGSAARHLPANEIFPRYAMNLRKALLKTWKAGSPTPVGYHSIAGVICDHLLLSIAGNEGEIPPFEELGKEDQQLVEALRAGGLIHLATWAPSDCGHIAANMENIKAQKNENLEVDYSGPEEYYIVDDDGQVRLTNFDEVTIKKDVRFLSNALKVPGIEYAINAVNLAVRFVLDKVDIHKRAAEGDMPYALRLMGSRMMKRVPFYGLFKEVAASLHDPETYQYRHIRALDAVIAYDIPYLSIIHRDDFMVSANRHKQEHDYLLAKRMEKDGTKDRTKVKVPIEFLLADRDEPDQPAPTDQLNPHLMLMSTAKDGEKLSRLVSASITRFVNSNVLRASLQKKTKPLKSVQKWAKENNR